jgi:phosphoribosylaminoimidazole carboxylase (NCAIR synthetase)
MINQVIFCLLSLSLSLSLSLIFDSSLHCLNDFAEIRKQRKMGHVTIVGPSMSDVEQRLKSMLKEEGSDCQSAG